MTAKNPLTLTDRILAKQADDKARAVLVAAFESFLDFGVKRTSMQDIADRAGMSRAALYLHYRNKDDIFRALMAGYFDAAAEAAAEALATSGDPVTALHAAFAAQSSDAAERMMASPHADEMMSAKLTGARDVVAEGEARLLSVYATWLANGVAKGRLSADAVGTPEVTAGAMMASVLGLKHAGLGGSGYVAARDCLAQLFGRALKA